MILVIPMAGRGSRFADRGFERPKPLIEVAGKPMLYHAFRSVAGVPYSKVIFIALEEHERTYGVSSIIRNEVVSDFELVLLPEVTEGQLCTVLTAEPYFKAGEGILVAASDSFVVNTIAADIAQKNADGLISVINLPGEQWSFAETDEEGRVTAVAEKKRISDHASTGIYYFSDAALFEQEARNLIADKETTKGEYYIMPLYNRYIKKQKRVYISEATQMWDMGTPEAKAQFENHLKSR